MFSFFSPQALHFGRGQSQNAAAMAAQYGPSVLLVHGSRATAVQWLVAACADKGLTVKTISCVSEPSLPDIKSALRACTGFAPDVVIGLGGGSVIDFAKALTALIPNTGDPLTYLEGVGGGQPLTQTPLPMIALPTTAGTGAEVTKNAVISVPEHGVKVSLRDPRMVPDIAIVDPALMQGAPKGVALSAGLDAVTQVIEPYLCTKSNPMTDALCRAAIPLGLGALQNLVENDAPAAWDDMAWVSTCGGLALANSGLGAVHGFAGVIGGLTNAPHGEICGALLPAVLQSHVQKAASDRDSETARRLGWVLSQIDSHFASGATAGLAGLQGWSRAMGLRGLQALGLTAADHPAVATASAGASSMKATPFALTRAELEQILAAAS